MNPVAIEYPFPSPPAAASRTEVADDICWIRMPLPFALDHINLWLLRDDDGWCIVDTGLNTPATRTLWSQLLDGLDDPVSGIVITHHHPDHIGLAGWLQARTGVKISITQTEWLTAHHYYNDTTSDVRKNMLDFFARHGLDETRVAAMRALGNRYRLGISPPPLAHRVLRAGDELRIGAHTWQVMVGRGHAPEHACLYCPDRQVLIAGDQVLPTITPNIMLHAAEPHANPLQDYLDSFDIFAHLAHDTLVLPSHGLPFSGLHARIADIRLHHDERLVLLAQSVADPRTATELLPVLFRRPLDAHQLMFAMGEVLAHLALLAANGDVVEQDRGAISVFQQSARGMVA